MEPIVVHLTRTQLTMDERQSGQTVNVHRSNTAREMRHHDSLRRKMTRSMLKINVR